MKLLMLQGERKKATGITLLLSALILATSSTASAHTGPAGARVDQELTVSLTTDGVRIGYATLLNRQAAFLEVLRIDRDGDGQLSPQEQQHYFDQLKTNLLGGLEVSVDGREVELKQIGQMELSLPFRKQFYFETAHPPDWQEGATVELHNDNYLDFPGTITVELDPGTAADIVYDSRWGEDATETLTATGDVQQRDLTFRYRGGSGNYDPTAEPTLDESDPATDSVPATGWSLGWIVAIGLSHALGAILLAMCRAPNTPPRQKAAGLIAAALVGGMFLAISFSAVAHDTARGVPPDVEAGQIFQRLHRHIYRAFDAQTEDELYDTLAQGLDGQVLDDVYNEVYEAMMVRAGGVTRFDVRRVKPIATTVLAASGGTEPAFRVRYRWLVYGTVTHFGHTHARFIEYEAIYTVTHVGRAWRITGSQVRQNKRVSIGLS